MWGKTFPQPRLIAWSGEVGTSYTYSGIHLHAHPWTPLLRELKSTVAVVAGTDFTSGLLNYYRDQRDSIGVHSDDEKELGKQPIIASVSLGEARTLILKHKTKMALPPVRLNLVSGSLLLMKGETQHYWKHGIGKEMHPCRPRLNLTFRHIGPCPLTSAKHSFPFKHSPTAHLLRCCPRMYGAKHHNRRFSARCSLRLLEGSSLTQ